jgi:hypothetical protein
MRTALVLVYGLFATISAAAAANQDTVPKELMAILMRGASPGEFDLRVGPPPDGFPIEVLPRGTDVGVSAVSERVTTVAGTVTNEIDRFAEEQRLMKAGWTNSMPRSIGFVSTTSEQPLALCKGTQFLTLHFYPRQAGGQFVRASVTTEPRRSCAPRPPMSFPDLKLPDLTPPEGVRSYPSGSGSSLDSMDARARLEKKITPEAAAKHYAAQMKAAGWTMQGITTTGDEFAIARFVTKSTLGDDITAFIAITSLAGVEEMDLLLHVVRNKSDRRFPGKGGIQFGPIIR